jgi:pyruvate formate lyase activating enzyme
MFLQCCAHDVPGEAFQIEVIFRQGECAEFKRRPLHFSVDAFFRARRDEKAHIYKLSDRRNHKKYTGADAGPILGNLRLLQARGANIALRLLLIPGINMHREHYDNAASLINRLRIPLVNLLPFHHYGKNKYAELGIAYPFGERIIPPDADAMSEARDYFRWRTGAKVT